ncbi:HNH endonuclease family protein [Gordonia sp. LSe1-13]|uniref:HNH endonuclease family protein n=1 Tax=Gordonia sesuvii TaxID=3116777 RepID=A0ABU7MHP2_9ACTN|nr:HNH endonuclease family protein [Gordonia sp. LSe1-13]
MRWWLVLIPSVATTVIVAAGVLVADRDGPSDPAVASQARQAMSALARVAVVGERAPRSDYQREAFGTAWTDAVTVAGGANGCDTRNDVLTRDLIDVQLSVIDSCPRAVMSGEFRSPYTGEFVVFRRDRRAGSVQIDHIVPLAYAWDMGAWAWPWAARANFANDPANLVAVDAASNMAKSDQEPARWLPPNRTFHCQYAIQFIAVTVSYRLQVDSRSADTLGAVLRRCGG